MKYIAKKDTWFKEGTECILITDLENDSGIFEGLHIVEDEIDAKNRNLKIGDECQDEELCPMDEFNIIEEQL